MEVILSNHLIRLGMASIIIYIISLTLPFQSYVSLFVLSFSGLIIAMFSYKRSFKIVPSMTYSLLFFLASMLLSSIMSADIKRSFLLSLSFFPALLLLFLISEIQNINHMKILYIIISATGMILSVSALVTVWNIGKASPTSWITIMGNPNILVPNDLILLSVILPFSLSLIYSDISMKFKLLSCSSILLSICVITIYQSRGAFLLSVISFGCMFILLRHSVFFYLIGVLIISALYIDLIFGLSLMSKFTGIWNTRLLYWLIAWAMFTDAPWIGIGLRAYGTLYTTYKHQIGTPEWLIIDDRFTPWTHNIYLEIMSEQGIVGLLTFLALLGTSLQAAWRIRDDPLCQKEIHMLGTGAFGGLVVFCLGGMFELSFIRHWVVIIFFMILGIITSLSYQIRKETSNEKCQRVV